MSVQLSTTTQVVLYISLFIGLWFAKNASEAEPESESHPVYYGTVHPVTILGAQLVDRKPPVGQNRLSQLSPLLQIKLNNLGTLCLVGQEYGPRSNGGKYFSDTPGCENLMCAGPFGPITTWTKYFTIKAIVKCISQLLEENEPCCENLTMEEFNERFNLRKLRKILDSGPEKKIRLISTLKIVDPKKWLDSVLPKEEDTRLEIIHRAEGLKHKVLLVDVTNCLPMPVNFCIFAMRSKSKDGIIEAIQQEGFKCTACVGNRIEPKEPWEWSDEDIQTTTMNCLALLYSKYDRDIKLRKAGHPTKKTKIRLIYDKSE